MTVTQHNTVHSVAVGGRRAVGSPVLDPPTAPEKGLMIISTEQKEKGLSKVRRLAGDSLRTGLTPCQPCLQVHTLWLSPYRNATGETAPAVLLGATAPSFALLVSTRMAPAGFLRRTAPLPPNHSAPAAGSPPRHLRKGTLFLPSLSPRGLLTGLPSSRPCAPRSAIRAPDPTWDCWRGLAGWREGHREPRGRAVDTDVLLNFCRASGARAAGTGGREMATESTGPEHLRSSHPAR